MFYSSTTEFIITPLANILATANESMMAIEDGMQNYPVADWVMPTVFLRMTGAQEQKLKCIYWDLGSMDLERRFHRILEKMGDMSCYDEKRDLCTDLVSFLVRNKPGYDPETDIDRGKLLADAIEDVKKACDGTLMQIWYADYYQDFEEITRNMNASDILEWNEKDCKCKDLLKGEMRKAFDAMYYHRNRCAHNTTSFQRNLPKFEALSGKTAVYENYFIRFFVLILLDRLFVMLYKEAGETIV